MREKQLAQEAKKLDAKVGGTKSWSGRQDRELRIQGAGSKEQGRTWRTKTHTHTHTHSLCLSPSLPWSG
jgi:hypothetical protein